MSAARAVSGQRTDGSSSGRSTWPMGEAEPVRSRIDHGQVHHRQLVRIPDVDPAGERAAGHAPGCPAPCRPRSRSTGSRAVAGDGQRLAGERLPNERGRHGAVAGPRPGPKVSKIRRSRVSAPCAVRNAVVSASAYRLASSYTLRGPTGLTLPQLRLVLRMLERVAVHLAGRGEHEPRALVLRQVPGRAACRRCPPSASPPAASGSRPGRRPRPGAAPGRRGRARIPGRSRRPRRSSKPGCPASPSRLRGSPVTKLSRQTTETPRLSSISHTCEPRRSRPRRSRLRAACTPPPRPGSTRRDRCARPCSGRR